VAPGLVITCLIGRESGGSRDSRDAAARPGKTLDEPKTKWFLGTRHHDGGLRSYLSHDHGYSVDGHQEHIDIEVSQFGGKGGKPLNSSLSGSDLNRDVCPSMYPCSPSACLNASRGPTELPVRYPILATFPAGCASATSGAARRPPAKVPKNARRSTRTPA